MPELPEVEVIRRSIQKFVEGKTIIAVIDSKKHTIFPELWGQKVDRVFRHGKCLFFLFPEKDALFIHLGMTGKLLVEKSFQTFPHHHLAFQFSSDFFLIFCDQRRFGKVKYLTLQEKVQLLNNLGIDPFSKEYTPENILPLLSGKRRVKDFLLDQRKVAGVGNIYASEILFRSGIHPERKLQSLTQQEKEVFLNTIPQVLEEAIRCQGTTIRDFRGAYGEMGTFQKYLSVYGKEGQPCPRCGHPISKSIISSRSTYFCSRCQR